MLMWTVFVVIGLLECLLFTKHEEKSWKVHFQKTESVTDGFMPSTL